VRAVYAMPPMPAQKQELSTPEIVNSSPEFILNLAADICEAYSKMEVGNGGIKNEIAVIISKIIRTMPAHEKTYSVKVYNKGGSGEFKRLEGIEALEDGQKLIAIQDGTL